ncbi:MAG: hypothetical protein ACR2HS_05825 [Gammaproteobacteria bacterium]
MGDLFYTIFIIWNWLWVIGLLFIFLRKDYKDVLVELFSMLIQDSLFFIFVSVLLLYLFIPFTIPHSIGSLINEKKDNDE